jgi:hypothetical protein
MRQIIPAANGARLSRIDGEWKRAVLTIYEKKISDGYRKRALIEVEAF